MHAGKTSLVMNLKKKVFVRVSHKIDPNSKSTMKALQNESKLINLFIR